MSAQYTIKRNARGERFVHLADGSVIPADIAGLCVGKDAWMAEIRCKCRECGKEFPLRELHGGGQWCEECQTADMDGGES